MLEKVFFDLFIPHCISNSTQIVSTICSLAFLVHLEYSPFKIHLLWSELGVERPSGSGLSVVLWGSWQQKRGRRLLGGEGVWTLIKREMHRTMWEHWWFLAEFWAFGVLSASLLKNSGSQVVKEKKTQHLRDLFSGLTQDFGNGIGILLCWDSAVSGKSWSIRMYPGESL